MLKRLKEQGITILVSTPYMDEAVLCDRVALIQTGKILSIDTPGYIIREFKKPLLAVRAKDMLRLLNAMKNYDETEDCYPFGEFHHAVMKKDFDKNKLTDYLEQQQFEELQMATVQPDIEDCFIGLMKGGDE